MAAETEAGANAQQAGAGASTDTGHSHRQDIGTDEQKAANVVSFAESLNSQRLSMLSDQQKFTNQVFQSSLTTMDMTAKQTLKAFEIATDRQWNVDEVAGLVAKLPTDLQGLSTIMTQAVAAIVARINEKTA